MNIKDLDLSEVSCMLRPYLEEHFNGFNISLDDDSMFQESYLLDFSEVEHLIPEKYHISCIDEWFNGASGTIKVESLNDGKTYEYTFMLLSNEDYSKALIFAIQGLEGDVVVIQDFIKSDTERNV